VTGLTPDSEHSVTVCAVEPSKYDPPLDVANDSVTTSFFTLREGFTHHRILFNLLLRPVLLFSTGIEFL